MGDVLSLMTTSDDSMNLDALKLQNKLINNTKYLKKNDLLQQSRIDGEEELVRLIQMYLWRMDF